MEQIIYLTHEEVKPYEKNPRFNDEAVEKVANSIKEFGFKVPIIIDKNNVIVTGHTRYKASQLLGMDKIPCLRATDLTPKQIKAFRVADNKVAEFSSWDFDLLNEELIDLQEDFNLSDFGFELNLDGIYEDGGGEGEGSATEDDMYTKEIKIPQYEIRGENPPLSDCLNIEKAKELIAEIEQAEISEEDKNFLKGAATRHFQFNFKNIAEYYAHASPQVQVLMEKSALVLIDLNDAIRYGYTVLNDELLAMMEEDENAE